MISLWPNGHRDAPRRVLVIGAHADDIEIGCGGTILRLIESWPHLEICWVVLSGGPERSAEAKASARRFLEGAAGQQVILQHFRDGYFPYDGAGVKDFFEALKTQVKPEIIFTHRREDVHQDHRLVSELTWNTFRNHLILEYEIPKYDADLGWPNIFVELNAEICRRKTCALLEGFPSQRSKHWFTEDLFLSVMRLRGMECGSPTRFAEGFCGRKVLL
jgi:LmbE family N-acetylglucosaminyl deacetylase